MTTYAKHIKTYMRDRGFVQDPPLLPGFLRATRLFRDGVYDVLQYAGVRDGGNSVQAVSVGLRIERVEAELERLQRLKWPHRETDSDLFRKASQMPIRLSVYQELDLARTENIRFTLATRLDALFSEYHTKYATDRDVLVEVMTGPDPNMMGEEHRELWSEVYARLTPSEHA